MALPELIREYGDEIEADLLERGFDLLDMWRGELSPRRVALLVRALPRDSATRQAMDADNPPWGPTDYLLADIFDAIQYLTRAVQAGYARKLPPEPKPYPRPGSQKRKKSISAADLLAAQERMKKR